MSLFDVSAFPEEKKEIVRNPINKKIPDIPQSSLFSYAYPSFKFTKPVRLIELFAGYGSQMMAMERLQKELSSAKEQRDEYFLKWVQCESRAHEAKPETTGNQQEGE